MRDQTPCPESERIVELLVKNHPGVMLHVANLFARRAFNLDGILCGPLSGGQSRMLLLVGAEARLDQVIRQLEKLHDVIEVRQRPDLPLHIFDVQRAAMLGLGTA
jgi:acetolactate synthase I/III small subunit